MNSKNNSLYGVQQKGIKGVLRDDISLLELEYTDSTNSEARRYAERGECVPVLIVAQGQSAGRGRLGRSFFSPSRTGLYMSLLLEAKENPLDNIRLTTAAAVAVSSSLEALYGIESEIKWVNDIYVGGRKVSGILAESFSANDRRYAVIGIGINVSTQEFPEEIKNKAASLGLNDADKAQLSVDIANRLYDMYLNFNNSEIMEYYRTRSMVLGKRISFLEGKTELFGIAEEIDDLGVLRVRLDSGEMRLLSYGEISVFIEK